MAEEHDDDLDVGSLRSMISSMREADEEPPASGLDALMAAAKLHAPKKKRPWFKQPPVYAFASIAILIGGAFVIAHPDAKVEQVAPSVAAPQAMPVAPPTVPATEVLEQANDQTRAEPKAAVVDKPRALAPHKAAGVATKARPEPAFATPNADTMPLAKSASSNELLLDSLAAKAASAAERGDCETAKALGTRAAATDPTYYREHVQPKISSCL